MRITSLKLFILLQVALYLIGGHATAHGLAWCISSEGHAHVATAAGCASEPNELSCTTSGSCISSADEDVAESHSGSECRHLPVTSPHSSSFASAQRVSMGSAVAILPTPSFPILPGFAAADDRQGLLPVSPELPRPVALTALRTIVLLI